MEYGLITGGKYIKSEETNLETNKRTVHKVYLEYFVNKRKFETTELTINPEKLKDDPREMILFDASNPSSAIAVDNINSKVSYKNTENTFNFVNKRTYLLIIFKFIFYSFPFLVLIEKL